jgi:cephalosporin-C deacetylase-like acetyl esterase
MIKVYRDMSRCLDHLETRPEFDKQKFVLHSLSFGAWMGPLFAALEKRYKAAILQTGGLENWAYRPTAYTPAPKR